MTKKDPSALFRVKPHTKVRLRDWNPAWTGKHELRSLETDDLKQEAQELVRQNLERLSNAQELLWASDRYA